MIVSNLIVGARESMNAPIDELHDLRHRLFIRLRLPDQSADDAKDIANAMIELGDEKLLTRACLMAFRGRLVCETQNDLDERRAQCFGHAHFGRREGLRTAFYKLLPFRKTFARCETRTIRSVLGRLMRISSPAD